MKTQNIALLLIVALPLLTGALRAAEPPKSNETKLREALRATMLQLRDAQNQVVVLQAAQVESDQKNKDLAAQVETLTKHAKADKEAAEKTAAELNSRVSAQDAEITKFKADIENWKQALEKWKFAYNQAAEIARGKEADRVKLANRVVDLENRVVDRETKNAELFKVGNEILTRYEKFGLGDALTAREPFVGITRVKLENLVQDYQDKLLNQRVSNDNLAGAPPTAANEVKTP